MAWTSTLAADLAGKNLPLVLAGPILRRVTPTSVTVWVALRKSRNVTLIVTDAYGADSGAAAHIQASANRDTVQIGTYLHLVAVTARLAAGKKLTPGPNPYFYDRRCHIVERRTREFCVPNIFKRPRLPRATCS